MSHQYLLSIDSHSRVERKWGLLMCALQLYGSGFMISEIRHSTSRGHAGQPAGKLCGNHRSHVGFKNNSIGIRLVRAWGVGLTSRSHFFECHPCGLSCDKNSILHENDLSFSFISFLICTLYCLLLTCLSWNFRLAWIFFIYFNLLLIFILGIS